MTQDLLDRLTTCGHMTVFCDDADLDAAPGMQPNVRILVSVETTSERYGPVEQALAGRIAAIGVAEFHATDMVNPSRKSDWRGVSLPERLDALAFVADQLNGLKASVGYIYCTATQYPALRAQAELQGKVSVGFRQGLKRVFLRSVLEQIERQQVTTLVVDQDRPHAKPRLDLCVEAPGLVGGGVVSAPSHLCPGLQLADVMAWSINRFIRHRSRFDAAEQNRFDDIALSVVGRNADRLRNLHEPSARAA